MSEMQAYINKSVRLSTAIRAFTPTNKLGYPIDGAVERFNLVGSVPESLTRVSTHGTPQHPPLMVSLVWDTEAEVIAALHDIGITHFQLSDKTWADN